MKKKLTVTILAIILGVGAIFTVVYNNNNKAKQVIANSLQQIPTYTVSNMKVVSTIDASGNVAFKNKVSVYAKNNGKVFNVAVKEGTDILKGEVILNYEKSTLETLERQLEEAKLNLKASKLALEALYIPVDESQLNQIKNQIAQSERAVLDNKNNIQKIEQDIQKAKQDLDNAKLLYEQGAISLNEVNTFQATLDNFEKQKMTADSTLINSEQQLKANKQQLEDTKNKPNEATNKNRIESQKISVQQAELKVKQLQKDISKYTTNITAPVSGTITKVNVTDGENIAEGKLVAEMGNLDDLYIEAYIPEFDMKGVKEGQKVEIKSDSLSETFEGSITKVFPIAEKRTIGGSEKSVVKVEISIPKNSGLKSGYSVKLNITTNVEDNAVVIPTLAYVTETNQDPYVFVVKDDNTLEKRRIKVKAFQSSVVSVEGLNVGEVVVASPTEDLSEGTEISPIGQGEAPQQPQMQNALGYNDDSYNYNSLKLF